MEQELPRIFVSIASFRDPECQHTVRDLFAKAAHPQRIFVGICWQLDAQEDQDCRVFAPQYPQRVRELHFAAQESKGSCWARAQALSLAHDEEYVLQIDAHMRFEPNWDDTLIDTLNRCPTPRAGLTATLPRYTPPDNLEDFTGYLPVSCVSKLGGAEDLQPIHLGGFKRLFERLRCKGPVPTPFMVGNFLFARRQMFEEVPFDPHIYFRGQEATYSHRLFTHGYDLYHPDSVVLYHYWTSESRGVGQKQHYKSQNEEALLGRQRVWHVLGIVPASDQRALVDIGRFGHGNHRPVEDFWGFAGVDIRNGTMEDNARYGFWTPYKAG